MVSRCLRGCAAGLVQGIGALLGDLRIGRRAASQQHVANDAVIGEGADDSPQDGPDYRDPEVGVDVAVVTGEGDRLPPLDPGDHARPEVASGVDRVAGVGAEGQGDREHDQADDEGGEVGLDRRVVLVGQREDDRHEEAGADHLVEERPDPRVQVGRGERREDRVGRDRVRRAARDVLDVLERVDRALVVDVDQERAEERAEQLRADVGQDLGPGEAAAERHRDRHGGIEVRPRDPARDVDPERHAHGPAPGDDQPVTAGRERLRSASGLVEPGDRHRDRPASEGDQREGPEHLRAELAGQTLLPAPASVP